MGNAQKIMERVQSAREQAGLVEDRPPEIEVPWSLAEGILQPKPAPVQELQTLTQPIPRPRPLPPPVEMPYDYVD